jgi:hypothetical protein
MAIPSEYWTRLLFLKSGNWRLSTYRGAALAALPHVRQQPFAGTRGNIFAIYFQFNEFPDSSRLAGSLH